MEPAEQNYQENNSIPQPSQPPIEKLSFFSLRKVIIAVVMFTIAIGLFFGITYLLSIKNDKKTQDKEKTAKTLDQVKTQIPTLPPDWQTVESKTCHIAMHVPPYLKAKVYDSECYFIVWDPQETFNNPLFELGIAEKSDEWDEEEANKLLNGKTIKKNKISIQGYEGVAYFDEFNYGGSVLRGARRYLFKFHATEDSQLSENLFHTLVDNIYFTGEDKDYTVIPESALEQFARTRNQIRKHDIQEIAFALEQYIAVNATFPLPITNSQEISTEGIDLCKILLPNSPYSESRGQNYIGRLPADPTLDVTPLDCLNEDYQTGYFMSVEESPGGKQEYTISAPKAELGEDISVGYPISRPLNSP